MSKPGFAMYRTVQSSFFSSCCDSIPAKSVEIISPVKSTGRILDITRHETTLSLSFLNIIEDTDIGFFGTVLNVLALKCAVSFVNSESHLFTATVASHIFS